MYYKIIVREKIGKDKLGLPKQEALFMNISSAYIHMRTLEYCFGKHYCFFIEETDLCTR